MLEHHGFQLQSLNFLGRCVRLGPGVERSHPDPGEFPFFGVSYVGKHWQARLLQLLKCFGGVCWNRKQSYIDVKAGHQD